MDISVRKYVININIPPTCFGHLCGHPQGGALQRIDTSRYYNSLCADDALQRIDTSRYYNSLCADGALQRIDTSRYYNSLCADGALQRIDTSRYYKSVRRWCITKIDT